MSTIQSTDATRGSHARHRAISAIVAALAAIAITALVLSLTNSGGSRSSNSPLRTQQVYGHTYVNPETGQAHAAR